MMRALIFFMGANLLSASHEEHRRFDIPTIPILGSATSNKNFDYIVVGAGTAGMTIGVFLDQFCCA
jgi:hypothetical protein